jgi:integrase/recombinase XerD
MPAWAKLKIAAWSAAAGLTSGRVFRPMNNCGQIVGEVLLPQDITETVAQYSRRITGDKVAPHDLRRYAESPTMPDAITGRALRTHLR